MIVCDSYSWIFVTPIISPTISCVGIKREGSFLIAVENHRLGCSVAGERLRDGGAVGSRGAAWGCGTRSSRARRRARACRGWISKACGNWGEAARRRGRRWDGSVGGEGSVPRDAQGSDTSETTIIAVRMSTLHVLLRRFDRIKSFR